MHHYDDPRDDPRIKRLRKIARLGQRALIKQVRDLRASWPTDDFLAILNADLPDRMDQASIEVWLDQAQYRVAATVEALSRFGDVPAPPRWIYQVTGTAWALGPVLIAHKFATHFAQALITERRRPRFRNPTDELRRKERELTLHYGAGLDLKTRVAFHDVFEVCRAAIARLTTVPDPWVVRLRRCPGPRCPARYFWNAHTRPDEKTCCGGTCQKALKRRSTPRR